MQSYEYYNALDNIHSQKEFVKKCFNRNSKLKKELQKLLVLKITIKGHAWSMDVASERQKMAKLMTKEILEIFL